MRMAAEAAGGWREAFRRHLPVSPDGSMIVGSACSLRGRLGGRLAQTWALPLAREPLPPTTAVARESVWASAKSTRGVWSQDRDRASLSCSSNPPPGGRAHASTRRQSMSAARPLLAVTSDRARPPSICHKRYRAVPGVREVPGFSDFRRESPQKGIAGRPSGYLNGCVVSGGTPATTAEGVTECGTCREARSRCRLRWWPPRARPPPRVSPDSVRPTVEARLEPVAPDLAQSSE